MLVSATSSLQLSAVQPTTKVHTITASSTARHCKCCLPLIREGRKQQKGEPFSFYGSAVSVSQTYY